MSFEIFADEEVSSFKKETLGKRNNVQTFVIITPMRNCKVDRKLKPMELTPLKRIDIDILHFTEPDPRS